MPDFPWSPGSATGVGSLPGTDIAEAQRIVFGELPDLPHLAELPARGPGADMIGRSAGFLVELPVQLYAGRWQVAPRPGKDLRVTADLLERDLDQLTEQGETYAGPLKIQSAGPWTLAASIDLQIGGRLLRDAGAVRDLTDSLAEGLRRHVDDVRKRLPRAEILLQLDEPSLPAVLAGRVPTESGLGAYRSVPGPDAASALRTVVEAVGVPVIAHCCAPSVPLQVFRDARAAAVALDLSLLKDLDPLGEALEAGLGLFAGAAPSVPSPSPSLSSSARRVDGKWVAERVSTLWKRLGFPAAQLPRQVVITPACGLAGASPAYVRAVLTACREAARRFSEV
ncbi:methionine synthase [Actinoplanes sp. LDG1-06]|uniref:Methionine synthase n=1 Tax=Paractinoplanes ovalisporus TaxID=2810368 RepID=A0ABS2ADL3_9ACTN|nr:methionine synthase [Actinoplanes ovalisporus]MBM2617468.1 methionine synthase [Actinoplanes ovalisporus]